MSQRMVFLRLFSIAMAGCRKIGREFIMRQRFKGTDSIQAGRDIFLFRSVKENEENHDQEKKRAFSRLAVKIEVLLACIIIATLLNTAMTMMRVTVMEKELRELRTILAKEFMAKERNSREYITEDRK